MNTIMSLTDMEFDKNLNDWPKEQKQSVLNLLCREVELQNEEQQRLKGLLKNAKDRRSNLEVCRYEQNIREGDMVLEKLERRTKMCDNKLTFSGYGSGHCTSPRHSIPSENSSPSKSYGSARKFSASAVSGSGPLPNGYSAIPLETRSLISNFENMSNSDTNIRGIIPMEKGQRSTKSGLSNNSYKSMAPPPPTSKMTTSVSANNMMAAKPRNGHTQPQQQQYTAEDSNAYGHVTLKKVGLPKDAKETDQDMYKYERKSSSSEYGSVKIRQPESRLSSIAGNTSYSRPISELTHSMNGGRPDSALSSSRNSCISSTTVSIKDRFHEPNREIRAAIEQEMQQISLRQVTPTTTAGSASSNTPASGLMSFGKFDFGEERAVFSSHSSSVATPLSASKSMPFLQSLSSITNGTVSANDWTDSPQQQLIIEAELNDEQFGNCNNDGVYDCLPGWDPRSLLESLYEIKKLSPQKQSGSGFASKLAEYMDVFFNVSRGSKYSRGFQRLFVAVVSGELRVFENQASRIPVDTYAVESLSVTGDIQSNIVDVEDSRGALLKLRPLKAGSFQQWMTLLQANGGSHADESFLTPYLYDNVNLATHGRKVLIVDLGSCSVRAGLLKTEPTLPAIYMPHVVAMEKATSSLCSNGPGSDSVAVGMDACAPQLRKSCHVIRLIKPDTTLEHVAFTSGAVEMVFTKICSLLKVSAKDYTVMLSVPHNVSDSTRTKLTNVLLLRLGFRGVAMSGQSLMALHAYGRHTGLLLDVGYRTEVLPITHGVVQTAGVQRSLLGGHLVQIALSHMLPISPHSLIDFFLVRHIMEKACSVSPQSQETVTQSYIGQVVHVPLSNLDLPSNSGLGDRVSLERAEQQLPCEGLFKPDIFSIDTASLTSLVHRSIMNCPVDCRRDLMRNICLSGAATQFPGLAERLERELSQLLHQNCDVKVIAAPDRAHFSYVGACVVAAADNFSATIVDKSEWEESRAVALKKWLF